MKDQNLDNPPTDDGERGRFDAASNQQDLLLPILRQLLGFCTLLGKVGSFRVGSVRAFRSIVMAGEQITAGVGVGSFWLTCALQWSFYLRFLVVAVLPVVVALLCFVGVRLAYCRTSWRTFIRAIATKASALEDPIERKVRCYLDASVIYCLYMAFTTVSHQIFSALDCTDIKLVKDGGLTSGSFITADFRVSCVGNGAYDIVRLTAFVLVGVYVVAPPVVLAWWISAHRSGLTDEMSMRRFGFLYRGYRLDAFPWWGCVSLMGKVAITAIVVFLHQDLEQMVAALLVFVSLLCLQMAAKPFRTRTLNNLQVIAYVALAVTQVRNMYGVYGGVYIILVSMFTH